MARNLGVPPKHADTAAAAAAMKRRRAMTRINAAYNTRRDMAAGG